MYYELIIYNAIKESVNLMQQLHSEACYGLYFREYQCEKKRFQAMLENCNFFTM